MIKYSTTIKAHQMGGMMKRLSLLILVFTITSCSYLPFNKKDSTTIDATQKSFDEFIAKYQKAIERKDTRYINDTTALDISYSFGETGDGEGDMRPYFLKFHKLDKNPKKSEFWNEMAKVLKLGCGKADHKSYSCPKNLINWPDDLDPYETLIVLSEQVVVYKKSDLKSEELTKLNKDSYVHFLDLQGKWAHIKLEDGSDGFVKASEVRSPLDYRASFILIDGIWHLESFIAGD
jgi:hypothetical protein